MTIKTAVAILIAALSGIVLAVLLLPPLLLRDAPAPASLAPFVEGARESLRSNSIERLRWWPLHLRFVEARCSTASSNRLALVFEEWRPPYLGVTYAVAWRGSMPSSPHDRWSGGLNMPSVYGDEEWVHQMGPNTVACT